MADKCVNLETKRPHCHPHREIHEEHPLFSQTQEEHKTAGFGSNKAVRGENEDKMHSREASVHLSWERREKLRKLKPLIKVRGSKDYSQQLEMACLINPGCFREIEELIKEETKGKDCLEVLSLKDEKAAMRSVNDLHQLFTTKH